MANANVVIVFVPGGVGTSLSLDGINVWNVPPPDFSGLRMILDPALSLPWLPLETGALVNVYDDLINNFLIFDLGYTLHQNLFLFPYDWRQGLPKAGSALAKHVNSTIIPKLNGRKIVFIAHSYGCMVTRWALTMPAPANPIDPSKVATVVAAGPHMNGIPQAFSNFSRMPQISDSFAFLYNLAVAAAPALVDQIQVPINRTLMAVAAQLYCLPDYKILFGGTPTAGSPRSPFDWTRWPEETAGVMQQIRKDLDNLSIANWPNLPRVVIASDLFPTEAGYLLDVKDQIVSAVVQPGDNTVLLESAKAFCAPGEEFMVNSPHRQLLDDPASRNYLIAKNVI